MDSKVAVFICFDSNLKDPGLLESITNGIEEEGIPYQVESVASNNFNDLAIIASNKSQLDIGIGLDASGYVCLHHAKLPDEVFLFEENHNNNGKKLRNIGVNGARLVKGIPFKIEETL